MAMMEGGGAGGGTLSEIYQSSKKLLMRTRVGLERLERLEFSSSSSSSSSTGMDSPELSFSVKRDLNQIQTLCVEMDRLWRSIGSRPQRDLWKRGVDYSHPTLRRALTEEAGGLWREPCFTFLIVFLVIFRKVEHVAEEVDSLRESLDKYTQRNQTRMMEAKERAELLGRANGESSHVLRIFDDEKQAMQSARNSSLMVDEAYSTGVAILSKYAEQRDLLKRAHRKALDVLNTTTLSNSVLKLIERRHRVDKWIAYTGMAVTILVVYFFWRWTH